jgi:DNA-binding transcriptional regulator GbsR (MarR family)
MIFDGRACSFGDLAIELQVSRGSISTNARILEQMGIIERVAKAGDRQDYFQLADDPYVNILTGALARSRKARDTVNKTTNALPTRGHAAVKARLADLEKFYNTLLQTLNTAIERSR